MEDKNFSSFKAHSFKLGLSCLQTTWLPEIGEESRRKREPLNEKDGNAIAVVRLLLRNLTEAEHPNTESKEGEIIGHIPIQMSQYGSKFLKLRTNNGKAVMAGKRVNRGAG